MKRFFLFLSGGIFLAIAVIAIGGVIFLRTDTGKAILDARTRPLIEQAVRESLGSEITYGRFQGRLPSEIQLHNIELSNEDGRWVSIKEVSLDWSVWAALRRKVTIHDLDITGLTIHRPIPDFPAKDDRDENDRPKIPDIELERLSLSKMTLMPPVLGQEYNLESQASAHYSNNHKELNAQLRTAQQTDFVDIALVYKNDRLTTDIEIRSAEDGVISQLGSFDGPVLLAVNGVGPLSEWAGTLNATLGAYGETVSAVTAQIDETEAVEFSTTFTPGEKISSDLRTLLGDSLSVGGAFTRKDGQTLLTLTKFDGAFGALEGSVSHSKDETRLDLNGDLVAEAISPYGAERLGGSLSLTVSALPAARDHGRPLSATMKTSMGRLLLREAFITDTGGLSGHLVYVPAKEAVEEGVFSALLQHAPRIQTNFSVDEEKRILLDQFTADLGASPEARLKLKGAADISLEKARLSGKVDATMDAALGKALGLANIHAGLTSFSLTTDGLFDDFSVNIVGETPSLNVAQGVIAPSTINVRIKNLPAAPSIKGTANAKDGSYKLTMAGTATTEAISLESLQLDAAKAKLLASGHYAPSTQAALLSASLQAPTGTKLPDGRAFTGQIKTDAKYSVNDGIDLKTSIDQLRIDDIFIQDLNAVASGQLDAINTSLASKSFRFGDITLLDTDVSALVDVKSEETTINLSAFETYSEQVNEEQRISLASPVLISLGDKIAISEAVIDLTKDARLSVQGSFSQERWEGSVEGDLLYIPSLGQTASIIATLDTDASIIADLKLTTSTRSQDDTAPPTLTIEGAWSQQHAELEATLLSGQKEVASAKASLPVELRQSDTGVKVHLPDKELTGQVVLDGPAEDILALIPDLPISAAGLLNGRIYMSGSLRSPEASGDLTWADGSVEDTLVGFSVQDVEAMADFTANVDGVKAVIDGKASDAKGNKNAIIFSGEVNPTLPNADERVNLALALNNAVLVESPELSTQLDAALNLTGSLQDMLLSGSINIKELDAVLPSSGGAGASKASYTPVQVNRIDAPHTTVVTDKEKDDLKIGLDLAIKGNNRIFIRGNGLTTEWSTDINVSGDVNTPILDGNISIRNGDLTFAGRDFEISEGLVSFKPDQGLEPSLNLVASHDTGLINAIMSVAGSPSKPRISLSSAPTRPQEDILALLLFGKQPTELTALETLQITNAVAQLSGISPLGGGPGVTNSLRNTIGLDALSMDFDPENGISAVEVGKYISDEIYVTARQKPGETGTEVSITYEVNDHVTVESTVKANGAQNVSAHYKHDY